jgi:hypothetical protein
MAAFFAFLGMLLLSLVVALIAALQLADFFQASEEFVLVIAMIAVYASASITVFAVGYVAARGARTINATAWALAALALAVVMLPRVVERIAEGSANPFTLEHAHAAVTLELLVPALLIVLVQWGLVRRRFLRAAGEEDLARWPWVTTVLAGLAILNPVGLAFVWSALRPSATDWLRDFTATVAAAAAGTLVVMALIECYIRGRMLRRRLAARLPPAGRAKA